jgi:hypothetical protein
MDTLDATCTNLSAEQEAAKRPIDLSEMALPRFANWNAESWPLKAALLTMPAPETLRSANESIDPKHSMERSDTELPASANRRTEVISPNLAKDRTERVEPKLAQLQTLEKAPNRETPATDAFDPAREKNRRDSADPKCADATTDT